MTAILGKQGERGNLFGKRCDKKGSQELVGARGPRGKQGSAGNRVDCFPKKCGLCQSIQKQASSLRVRRNCF